MQETLSFRKALFNSEGHGKLKLGMRCGRFGPFSEQFVSEIDSCKNINFKEKIDIGLMYFRQNDK